MADKRKKSILIVDDDNGNIIALTHILRPEYTVYVEKNGLEALKTAAELMPDIILLDIIMPETDGYSVLKDLKACEKTNNIPVIFISGLCSAESVEKGLSSGAADYITKPYDPADLKIRIENQIMLISKK